MQIGINQKIEKQFKDKQGSVAKNRLQLQVSFALKLLVDFHKADDFVLFLDCIEDVALKTITSGNEKIHIYQIKTKKGQFTLSSILKDENEWIQKLYKYKSEYQGCNYEVALVTNDFITDGNRNICANEKANIECDVIEYQNKKGLSQNLKTIKQKISEYEDIPFSSVDLSNYYFIKTSLQPDFHKEQAHAIISNFIVQLDERAEAGKIKAFFIALSDTLDSRFNCELEPLVSDYAEIEKKKGFTKTEFVKAVNDFLNESIPKSSELFMLLGITSAREQREINSFRTRFLMDLSKQDAPFKKLNSIIDYYVSNADTSGDFLADGVDYLFDHKDVSTIYKDIGYLKFALLYRYRDYINGGNRNE